MSTVTMTVQVTVNAPVTGEIPVTKWAESYVQEALKAKTRVTAVSIENVTVKD